LEDRGRLETGAPASSSETAPSPLPELEYADRPQPSVVLAPLPRADNSELIEKIRRMREQEAGKSQASIKDGLGTSTVKNSVWFRKKSIRKSGAVLIEKLSFR
jgi:hypothetical protein